MSEDAGVLPPKLEEFMRTERALATTAMVALATAACTTDPYTGQQRVNRTAVGIAAGAIGGYLLGDLVGGSSDRT